MSEREMVCIRSSREYEPLAQTLQRKLSEQRCSAVNQVVNDGHMGFTILKEAARLAQKRPRILILLWNGVSQGFKLEKIRQTVAVLDKDKLVILVEIRKGEAEVGRVSGQLRTIFTGSAGNTLYRRVEPGDTTVGEALCEEIVRFLSPPGATL